MYAKPVDVPMLKLHIPVEERDDLMLAIQTLRKGTEVRSLPEDQQDILRRFWEALASWDV